LIKEFQNQKLQGLGKRLGMEQSGKVTYANFSEETDLGSLMID
jgi:hypothetical protein